MNGDRIEMSHRERDRLKVMASEELQRLGSSEDLWWQELGPDASLLHSLHHSDHSADCRWQKKVKVDHFMLGEFEAMLYWLRSDCEGTYGGALLPASSPRRCHGDR
jgi:hypothetical protein